MSTRIAGHCPVCERDTVYTSSDGWYRDHLLCAHCGSIPRERALAWALRTFAPDWRNMVIHESSPADRSISRVMRQQAKHLIASHYYPDKAPGTMFEGFRVENLEAMSFADDSIDLHVHLDVLEHVNQPTACFEEMARTLKPGG